MRWKMSTLIALSILIPGGNPTMAKPAKGSLAPASVKRSQKLAMGALKAGNQWFLEGETKTELDESGKWAKMQKGQKPWAMVLSCSDSRVVPEILFNRKPGDLFVCRVAGNVADPDTIASLEYGAEHLNISVLVVLGHDHCGAIAAAREFYAKGGQEKVSHSMRSLMSKLEPCLKELEAVKKNRRLTEEKEWDVLARANVRNTIRTLLEQSPALWQLWHEQRLKIVGAVYSLKTGKVVFLER